MSLYKRRAPLNKKSRNINAPTSKRHSPTREVKSSGQRFSSGPVRTGVSSGVGSLAFTRLRLSSGETDGRCRGFLPSGIRALSGYSRSRNGHFFENLSKKLRAYILPDRLSPRWGTPTKAPGLGFRCQKQNRPNSCREASARVSSGQRRDSRYGIQIAWCRAGDSHTKSGRDRKSTRLNSSHEWIS